MRKFFIFLMIAIMITASISLGGASWAGEEKLSYVHFANDPTEYWSREMANNVYSGTFSDQYSISGLPAYRIELRDTDPNILDGKRSEIATVNANDPGGEYIYKFSIMLPQGGDEDYAIDPEGSEIIAQWHNQPDPGEDWTPPSIAIHTGNYNKKPDHYTLELNWDASPITTDETLKNAKFDLGSFTQDKGRWVDWEVHVKWGWVLAQNPLIQISKDGQQIFELVDHPNTTNDRQGVKMKLGLYKWDWTQGFFNYSILHKRVIYFNNVSFSKVTG